MWLFSLDGKIDSLPEPPDSSALGAPPGRRPGAAASLRLPAGPANLARGGKLYHQFCVACHGETGLGGTGNGASLATIGHDAQAVADTAWNGRKTMPAFHGTLTPMQMRDVANYVAYELFRRSRALKRRDIYVETGPTPRIRGILRGKTTAGTDS